jgi:hypothetical protein
VLTPTAKGQWAALWQQLGPARRVNQHRRSFAAIAGTGAPWWFQQVIKT